MLDDLKFIHDRDAHDALGIAEKQWQQLQYQYELPPLKGSFDNIVHAGMGGSALWALLSTSWPGYTVPFEVVRDYDTPSYVNDKTLFIASSYSGNTEEITSALSQAEEKGATIAVITSGGKLEEIAKAKGYTLVALPKIDKPRYGALYGLRGLVTLAEGYGLLADKGVSQAMEQTAEFLKAAIAAWLPTVPVSNNQAKQLALELMGRSPVMYAGTTLFPAAHKWKISFNENAKNVAWTYAFPEFNHNEFTGWTSHPTDKPYGIIYLQSSFDHPRVKKRFDLSEKLLSGRWPAPHRVEAQGGTKLEQLLWTVALGDFVSLYLAFLNGSQPIETGDKDIIERFKKELG
ncbi:MAG TPA: bifunctional phosphoglucose/phosphomannose isomerase [Candidatus Limnocylindrales bacterium]|nr:bifunctional phosphoglucose/phosphomannose isomerase [Candidatus Limnocylindrales bacterium]